MANDHGCIRVEDIAQLRERVKGILERQERHHTWINTVETDCRSGREKDMGEVDVKFEKVLEALSKANKFSLKMTLTIIFIFGSLFSVIAYFLANGR